MAVSADSYASSTLARWHSRRTSMDVKLQLTVDKVVNTMTLAAAKRVRIAGELLRDRIVVNLSRPVRKYKSRRTGRIAVDPASRSKPGEFPRADTTRLMKSIFHEHDAATATSRVGTNLKYGVILEFRMNRSFIRRTLNEIRSQLMLIVRGGEIISP